MIPLLDPRSPAGPIDPETARVRLDALSTQISDLTAEHDALAAMVDDMPTRLSVFQGYIGVGVVAFTITILLTPLIRRLAITNGIIDHPDSARKVHRMPIAYLGGVAVFLGVIGGIFFSYVAPEIGMGLMTHHPTEHMRDGITNEIVPLWIVAGISVIAVVGLLDDVFGVSPRVKIGGQLFGAAALAWGRIGTNVAAGILKPTLGVWLDNENLIWTLFEIPASAGVIAGPVEFDLIYWSGTAIIAIFVLGACNASNLIDGLDGLLTGVTSIAALGLLVLALGLAVVDDGPLDGPRIVLCLAVLGACLGFLPHNFNPATIFLGDCGSLLLGYCSAVMILSMGDTGKTYLVFAGLIIYAIPIVDTVLAIVRRKMAGKRMSDADSDHLHHMLKRAVGVKGAVLTLYGFGVAFCVLGVAISQTRARFVYALAILFVSYIAVYAIKIARRRQWEGEALHAPPPKTRPSDHLHDAEESDEPQPTPGPAPSPAPDPSPMQRPGDPAGAPAG